MRPPYGPEGAGTTPSTGFRPPNKVGRDLTEIVALWDSTRNSPRDDVVVRTIRIVYVLGTHTRSSTLSGRHRNAATSLAPRRRRRSRQSRISADGRAVMVGEGVTDARKPRLLEILVDGSGRDRGKKYFHRVGSLMHCASDMSG